MASILRALFIYIRIVMNCDSRNGIDATVNRGTRFACSVQGGTKKTRPNTQKIQCLFR